MLNRTPTKKYLLTLPLSLWEKVTSLCNNEWGKVASFIRKAIEEKLEREKDDSK